MNNYHYLHVSIVRSSTEITSQELLFFAQSFFSVKSLENKTKKQVEQRICLDRPEIKSRQRFFFYVTGPLDDYGSLTVSNI